MHKETCDIVDILSNRRLETCNSLSYVAEIRIRYFGLTINMSPEKCLFVQHENKPNHNDREICASELEAAR